MLRPTYSAAGMLTALALLLGACASPATATQGFTTTPAPAPIQASAATLAVEPAATAAADAAPTTAAETGAGSVSLPPVDPGTLSGSIYAAGSSTVYPLIEAVAEEFNADGFSGEFKIDSVGTGGGMERFCKTGETDIANASRPINATEQQNCAALNPARTPLEFRVGTDAIAIVVSKDNTFLTNVTIAELEKIFTNKAVNWSDVNPAWPATPIDRYAPGTDSGTFDFFVETVIQKPNKIEKLDDAKALALSAANLHPSEDDNVLVQGVEGSPNAVGYFGFAYYLANKDRLKVVSVEGITPDLDTAESGKYPLARPLFIYSDANVMKDKPQVAAFINYFLTNVDALIEKVGYFPASQQALDGAKQTWLDTMK